MHDEYNSSTEKLKNILKRESAGGCGYTWATLTKVWVALPCGRSLSSVVRAPSFQVGKNFENRQKHQKRRSSCVRQADFGTTRAKQGMTAVTVSACQRRYRRTSAGEKSTTTPDNEAQSTSQPQT